MISNLRYWIFVALICFVYLAGMFVTLFENDSAQFSVMAMRMVQENDFLHLFKGPNEYLDKPHMHYWLAALSYKLFGIHDWAYRIPGVLATLLAAYSCYGLGNLLYNTQVGKTAALIFMTAQTIVLGAIDVRTDAVLTGFSILAIWQLVAYIEKGTVKAIIIGAFAAGIAFSTKGQIALLVIGLPIFCHLLYTKKWSAFMSWKVILALVVFAITIAPMLYAYYVQFDLHPEKVIRGKSNRSGIFFIFWEQSFERLSGDGIGKNSSDFFFFFHTFLWVFLPWTLTGISAFYTGVKTMVKQKFSVIPSLDFLTVGGIALIFLIISFAQFKLPHYLNITIPLFAVLSAAFLCRLSQTANQKILKILVAGQYFILLIVCCAAVLVCYYVFNLNTWYSHFLLALAFAAVFYFCIVEKQARLPKLLTMSVCTSLLLNGVLNLHFYPNLLAYQGGSTMAKIINENKIPAHKIFKIAADYTWALDFYTKHPVEFISKETLANKKDIWVYLSQNELNKLMKEGYRFAKQFSVNQFRITRLQGKFLNPDTREHVTHKMFLVYIN